MTKKLEKTYRQMLKEGKEADVKKGDDEEKDSVVENADSDEDDMDEGNEAELNAKLKKGLNKLKGSNKPTPINKLKEAKKLKETEDDDEDDVNGDSDPEEKDDGDVEEAKKSKKLKESKKRKKLKETEDDDEDDVNGDSDPEEKDDATLGEDLRINSKKAVSNMGTILESQESLDEEHKEQVKTLFEAALSDRTKMIRESIQANFDKKLEEAIELSEESLIESLDSYLDKVVAEWLDENRLAVESGVKSEITESFLGAMKAVFEDHYVDVPDEKMDIVESIINQNEDMEEKLNASMKAQMDAESLLESYKKIDVISEISEDLTLTEKERLLDLTEEIDFIDPEHFARKAKTIKENFLQKTPSRNESEILNEDSSKSGMSDTAKRYGDMLSRMSINKFSPSE